ncbi:MAG TPA: bifunctional DNA primase/polymerase [Vicinamibacterales bacterium]|nr:bifunctional DNA primase/polymerase [Vicinamibacterales bacterium]
MTRPAIQQWAAHYIQNMGFAVVPLESRSKKCLIDGWPNKTFGIADFGADANIGIRPIDGLVMVDDDFKQDAPACMDDFLPPTAAAFGRGSLRRRKRLYRCADLAKEITFTDIDGTHQLQLRVNGRQDMAPPSIHPDTGERLTWDGLLLEPATVVHDRLVDGARWAWTARMIAQYWPARGRHDLRLAYARVLLETLEIPDGTAVRILEWACRLGGSDAKGIADARGAVESTRQRLTANEDATGAATIGRLLPDTGNKIIAQLRRAYGTTDNDVVIRGGALSTIVDRTEAALLAATARIYQRGGALIRPVRLDTAVSDAPIRRAAGSTVLIAVKEPWLVEQMGRALRWVRETKDGGRTLKDPPAIYARTLLGRSEWKFPVLRNVVTTPTLDRDGRIIATPGFDKQSGLLLDFEPDAFPPVPEYPTQDDAREALNLLAYPLRGFPFEDDAAKSVALSAMLTALVRSSLRSSPLHGFDAPTAGTGKTLLTEAVGLIATGCKPAAMSQGKSEEEDEKRLSTVLFAGDPVILIDNCERPVSGDFLCSMATSEVVQARILGLSERRVLPSTALVLLNGNNLTFAGDTSRRAVKCRLDAQVEQPDARTFDFDCHSEIRAARPELVVAGLTVLRAYVVAGRPARLTPMGSFDDYEWIRGSLVWLGRADPNATRAEILRDDPRKNELVEVMELWAEALGTEAVEVSEIDRRAEAFAEGGPVEFAKREHEKALRDKLNEVACRGGRWSGKSVGWWLRRHKDRVVGGRCFICEAGRDGQRWKLCASLEKPEKPALAGL